MSHRPLEDLLPKAGFSTYKLARLAAERAKELAEGKPKLIKKPSGDKIVTIVFDEIYENKVMLKGLPRPGEGPQSSKSKDDKKQAGDDNPEEA